MVCVDQRVELTGERCAGIADLAGVRIGSTVWISSMAVVVSSPSLRWRQTSSASRVAARYLAHGEVAASAVGGFDVSVSVDSPGISIGRVTSSEEVSSPEKVPPEPECSGCRTLSGSRKSVRFYVFWIYPMEIMCR